MVGQRSSFQDRLQFKFTNNKNSHLFNSATIPPNHTVHDLGHMVNTSLNTRQAMTVVKDIHLIHNLLTAVASPLCKNGHAETKAT